MPSKTRRVVFARINRRPPDGEETIAARSFWEDMAMLVESRGTTFSQSVGEPIRIWFAEGMGIEPGGDFMTGILGYTTPGHELPDTGHWVSTEAGRERAYAARKGMITPFAVDIRDQNRWVSFAPTPRLQPRTFTHAFERILYNAVASGRWEWEVDLVVSRVRVYTWIQTHPLVYNLKRTVKFTNPGRDLDVDRQEMRALAARRKTEEFAASSNGVLNTASEEFKGKLDGVDTGDIDLILHSYESMGMDRHVGGDVVFSSRNNPDTARVESFGGDLARGRVVVLAALRQYVLEKLSDRDESWRFE